MARPRTTKAALDARERARRALELRIAGLELEAIAERLGYGSRQAAWAAIGRVLERADRDVADAYRDLHRARLGGLLAASWPAAREGDKDAATTALRVLDQLAKLDGLYAATRLEASGPAGAPIALEGRVDYRTWQPDAAWLAAYAEGLSAVAAGLASDEEPGAEPDPAAGEPATAPS